MKENSTHEPEYETVQLDVAVTKSQNGFIFAVSQLPIFIEAESILDGKMDIEGKINDYYNAFEEDLQTSDRNVIVIPEVRYHGDILHSINPSVIRVLVLVLIFCFLMFGAYYFRHA